MIDQIRSSVTDVAGALQSKFGPVSRTYFVAKRVVATQHRQGNLNENSISGYARAHRLEEVTIGLSLLCSLPGDVIERAVFDRNRETLLILAKALDFSWATTMSLLFLGAKDHRITAQELSDLESEFGRLNVETSRSVLEFYRSQKECRYGAEAAGRSCGLLQMMNSEWDRDNERNRIRRAPRENASDEAKPDNAGGCGLDRSRSRERSRRRCHCRICRRVIDASLNGGPASPSDLHVVVEYFR